MRTYVLQQPENYIIRINVQGIRYDGRVCPRFFLRYHNRRHTYADDDA